MKKYTFTCRLTENQAEQARGILKDVTAQNPVYVLPSMLFGRQLHTGFEMSKSLVANPAIELKFVPVYGDKAREMMHEVMAIMQKYVPEIYEAQEAGEYLNKYFTQNQD